MSTDASLIELTGVGQRADGFGLRLLNTDRSPLGVTLQADASSAPTVQVDGTRTTVRTMTGLRIVSPPSTLDVYRARIQPVMILPNGSQYALGVLMFGTDKRSLYTSGDIWQPELFDETFLLDQNLDQSFSLAVGDSVLDAFTALASEILMPLGIPWQYDVADVPCASPVTYRVGTSRNAALQAMAAMLAAMPPYFDNAGNHRLKYPPTALTAADHTYVGGTRIFDGTQETTNSLYKAPNEYIVIGDDLSGVAVRGVYDLPDSAPNSFAQTGRVVTATPHSVPGVTDTSVAAQIAYIDALTDRATYATAQFGAAADPRHDVLDTVSYLGDLYIEQGWSLPLSAGADHTHQLSRIWGSA